MRVNKYRAWNHYKKEMRYNWCMFETTPAIPDIGVEYSTTSSSTSSFTAHEVMQFTGLHDKNGKEIYEGDILDFEECVWGGSFTPEVVPSIDEFIKGWPLCGSFYDVAQYRRVIGNIYENPELIG